jgi:SAM-dependent methyltransferase
MIEDKNKNLAPDVRICRICGSDLIVSKCIIQNPASRAGVFYFCKTCAALSFYAAKNIDAYAETYYGCGNSKVGGFALRIRTLSASRRANFASKLVGGFGGLCFDIGCGDGEFLKAMRHLSWEVKGTELPGPAFERAERKIPCRIVCTAQFETALEPNSCKLITMWQVFEHLENPLLVLKKCSGLLIRGGVLGIGVPNPMSWQALMGKHDWLHLDPPRHLHLQKVESLIKAAESIGFKCIAIRYPWLEFGPIGWIQTFMNKLGFSRDFFFERMKDRWTGVSLPCYLAWTITAAIFAFPAFILAFLESLTKHSATYEVYFRLGSALDNEIDKSSHL